MITYKVKLVVTHNDVFSEEFRKNLTKEKGWTISEDTTCTVYEKMEWYGFEEGDNYEKNESS